MADNNSLYGSTTPQGAVSSSNYTTLYNGGNNYVPSGDNVIISGTLTVNGCSILTDCSAFSLLPANALTINAFNSATAVSIGGSSGVTTIQNQLATGNYLFPLADGTNTQVLATDGNGVLYWANNNDFNTTYTIDASTTSGGANFNLVGSDSTTDTIKFAQGSNVTVSRTDANTITIASSYVNTTYSQNSSSTTGGANLNLVGSDSSVDAVKFASGVGIAVSSTDANTITITNTNANLTYNIDASATTGGANFNLTGSDSSLDTIKFANGTGMSIVRTDANTITFANTSPGTTYTQNASATSGGANLNLVGSDSTNDAVKFASGTGITVSRTDADTITITNTAPDTNTTYTQDFSSTSGGTNLNLRGSDSSVDTVKFANGTGISIAYTNADTATLTNTGVTSLVAGTGVGVSAATGAVTVSIGQSVATSASPTFAGMTLNGELYMNGSTSGSVHLNVPAIAGSSQLTLPAAVDTLVARNTTDTLTNKTISGVNNTITGIGNSSLVNSSITLGTTTTALGATSLTLGGLTSVAVTQDPVSNLQLATKQYVDQAASSGLTYHEPVHLASDAPLGSVLYNNGAAGVGATLTNTGTLARLRLDNSNATNGDRVLIKNETNQAYNGVYVVTNQGSGAVAWVLTRATDADTYGSAPNQLSLNDYFFVQTGATQRGNSYVLNAPTGVIIFGTSNITFAEFSSSQVYTATAPIVITGTDISLTTVPITLGGTGQTTANAGLNALLPSQSGNAGKLLLTDGTNTSWTDFSTGFTTGNITLAVVDDNTISTTAGDLVLDAATNNVAVTGNFYVESDTTLNTGTVKTNSGTVSLFNSTATTAAVLGAATSISMAASSGTTTINNSLNAGSGTLFVDKTTTRVGVNTTTPIYELDVRDGGDGYVQFALTNTEREFVITNNAGDDLVSISVRQPAGSGTYANRLQFDATGGNQWFASGNLGVNNNAPTEALDVAGNGKFSGNVAINGGSINTTATTANIFPTNATTINFGTMNTSAFSTNNVISIGTNGITYATQIGGLLSQNGNSTQAASRFLNITQTTPYLIMNTTRTSMKGIVTVTDDVTGAIHSIEYLAIRKGTTLAYITIYGEIFSDAPLATFTVTADSNGLNLFASPLSTNSTDIYVMRNSNGLSL